MLLIRNWCCEYFRNYQQTIPNKTFPWKNQQCGFGVPHFYAPFSHAFSFNRTNSAQQTKSLHPTNKYERSKWKIHISCSLRIRLPSHSEGKIIFLCIISEYWMHINSEHIFPLLKFVFVRWQPPSFRPKLQSAMVVARIQYFKCKCSPLLLHFFSSRDLAAHFTLLLCLALFLSYSTLPLSLTRTVYMNHS